MITLYHRTNEDAARQIVANGFRDGEGNYMTLEQHSGVWVSDQPLDENEGARGNALMRIELPKNESEIASFEWIEEGKPYREWLIPAAVLNTGTVMIQEIDPPFGLWSDDLEGIGEKLDGAFGARTSKPR